MKRALLAVPLAVCGLAWLRRDGSRAMFQPPTPPRPVVVPRRMELLRTSGPHGVPILWSPPPPGATTVVYLHGNGVDISTAPALLMELRAAGFGAAAVEYVGYGTASDRSPSPRRLVEGSCAALDTITARPEVGRVVLLGFSLGSAVATQVAARRRVDRLVLGAPFTSAADLARRVAPYAPPVLFLDPRRLDSEGTAPSVTVPTLVVHGAADDQIPCAMGRSLARAFPRGRFLEVPDADHAGLAAGLVRAVRIADADPEDWPASWPASSPGDGAAECR